MTKTISKPSSNTKNKPIKGKEINHKINHEVIVVSCQSAFPISQSKRVKRPQSSIHSESQPNNGHRDTNIKRDNNFDRDQNGNRKKINSGAQHGAISKAARVAPREIISSGSKTTNIRTTDLDWSQTAREIHELGATGFVGRQKSTYQKQQYEILTGRKKKNVKMPLPMVRHLRKVAAEKNKKSFDDAKKSGIVLSKSLAEINHNKNNNTIKKRNDRKKDKDFQCHGPSPSIGFVKNGIYRAKKI